MNAELRVLTVMQPWASLIASGQKTIELRSWATKYRGLVVIGSSASKHARGSPYEIGPKGRALCVVRLVDVRLVRRGDRARACCRLTPGQYAWELELVALMGDIPCAGGLGLRHASESLRLDAKFAIEFAPRASVDLELGA